MSEIERAIEVIEGYIKAVEQRMQSGDCGVVVGYDAMVERRAGLKTALEILRAELEREKNPLTCDGCKWQPKMLGVTRCQKCARFPLLTDRFIPKGEKA